MQRAFWRGAISFGLIYVPVEMHTASRDESLDLHMLDSRDFAPVGNQRINKKTGETADWQHIVKGYQYEKGHFVALSEADFKHAHAKASETIEIATFTEAATIGPMYFETPYHLIPSNGGAKVYALLAEALRRTEKAAIATFLMRGRQHLCAVLPNKRSLMLITLRFSDELLPLAEAEGATASAAARVLGRIREKVKKKPFHAMENQEPAAPRRPKADVIDLLEALQKSLKSRSTDKIPKSTSRTAAKARKRA